MTTPPDDDLQALSTEILSGMREWRSQHPAATFREIECEVDARLACLRARLLEHTAQTSAPTDWADQPLAQQPQCPDCATPRTRRARCAGIATTAW